MEWGDKLDFLKGLQEQGQRVKALEERPTLTAWTVGYYEAFQTLSESRPIYMGGLGPIPLTEIAAYCALYQIDDIEEVDRLVTMMRALDSEYLKLMAERKAKAPQSNVAGPKVRATPRGRMRSRS